MSAETSLEVLRQFVKDYLAIYHDEIITEATTVHETKLAIDEQLAEFVRQAQLVKDKTGELALKAERVDDFADEIAGKSNKGHTHDSTGIVGTTSTGGDVSLRNLVVKTSEEGHLHYSSSPQEPTHLSNKKYVDDQLLLKAEKSHQHDLEDINGLPTSSYEATPSSLAFRNADGRLQVGEPVAPEDVSTRGYVDKRISEHQHSISSIPGLQDALDAAATAEHTHVVADITGLAEALGNRAPLQHKHTISDITDLPTISSGSEGGALVKRQSSGAVTVPTSPSSTTDAASKSYVDVVATGKSDTNHTHSVSQITDFPARSSGVVSGAIVVRDGTQVKVPTTPTQTSHATSKSYVDGELSKKLGEQDTKLGEQNTKLEELSTRLGGVSIVLGTPPSNPDPNTLYIS